MNQIQIANILVTRRCNLSCEYCNIVKNYNQKPEEYPKMSHYSNNELTGEEWIKIFQRVLKNNPDVFFIIYGGEPFLYNDLWKIIKFCNNNNVNYTVISNNTNYIQSKIEDVYRICGKYKGFTSSVDPIVYMKDDNSNIFQKSNLGMTRLIYMKENNMIDDCVAEITVTKSTIPYLYQTVETLSENGIYSSITTLDDAKNKYYDFSKVIDILEMVEPNSQIKEQFNLIKNDKTLLIHMPELLDVLYDMLPSKGDCTLEKDFHNATIDADGTFRLCLRIKGIGSPKLSLNEVIDEDGKIQNDFHNMIKKDKMNYCKGCNWTCPKMSEMFSDQIVDHGIQNR